MTFEISVVVSKKDSLSTFAFGYFSEAEAPRLKAFAESLGYHVIVEESDQSFKDVLTPYRKKMVRDINWHNPANIEKVYFLAIDGKNDGQIVKALGSFGSGFSITVKRGMIMTEYAMYERLEGKRLTLEQIKKYAELIANKFMATDTSVENKIKKLKDNGCKVGTNAYPECLNGFNPECFKCPHCDDAHKPIRNEIDIIRFNDVWRKPAEQ